MRTAVPARVLAACFLLAAALFAFSDRVSDRVSDPTSAIESYLADAPYTWKVEDRFYAYENSARIGGFYAVDQVPAPSAPSPYRVLVLGDSYTFGWGLMDLDLRWPELLEDELARATGDRRFEVHTLALGGSSTFTHARLLEDLRAGRLDAFSTDPSVSGLTGNFDALVLGFVANDVLPGTFDGATPDPDLESRVLRGLSPNPHAAEWERALRSVASFDASVRLFVPLDFTRPGSSYAASLLPFAESVGFDPVDLPTLARRLSSTPPSDLVVHPADAHPGPAVLDAYAKDVATAILRSVDHPLSHAASAAPLVSNALPAAAVVSSGPGTATVEFPPAADLVAECGLMIPCRADGAVFELDGKRIPPRVYPCAPIDAPHAYVGLDPVYASSRVEISLAGPGSWLLYPVVRRDDGSLHDLDPLPLGEGRRTQVVAVQGLKGIRLVPDAQASGCTDPGKFPGAVLTLSRPTPR